MTIRPMRAHVLCTLCIRTQFHFTLLWLQGAHSINLISYSIEMLKFVKFFKVTGQISYFIESSMHFIYFITFIYFVRIGIVLLLPDVKLLLFQIIEFFYAIKSIYFESRGLQSPRRGNGFPTTVQYDLTNDNYNIIQ